jgi:hypothetical protein
MKVWMFVMFFLLFGAFFIISANNLALKNPGTGEVFLVKYIGWFQKVFKNTADITAYAVKQNWMP